MKKLDLSALHVSCPACGTDGAHISKSWFGFHCWICGADFDRTGEFVSPRNGPEWDPMRGEMNGHDHYPDDPPFDSGVNRDARGGGQG